MLITGPNAGGKTVTLKTIGLLSLMAQAGLHVPAEEAHFPLFDGIYADIGDQQSIDQSLSTFSSHIRNLRSIIAQATASSLVLLDELGTSTDPEEGSALAKAILTHFQRRGVPLVATTHHRSVARYVQEQPGMINASVDLDTQTLEPTYRVTLGLPGRSYALTIAARLGIDSEIVEQAQSLLSPEERSLESLLRELQQERYLVDRLRQETEASLAQTRQQQAEVEARLAFIETTKRELVEEARQELQARIAGLLSQLQQVERSLERPQAPAMPQEQPMPSLDDLRTTLHEARRQVSSPHWQPIELKLPVWQDRLHSGDRVFIRGIPRPVEVITPPDAQGQVEVLLGTMRAKIPVYQLDRQEDQGHEAAARHGVYFVRSASSQPNSSTNLRQAPSTGMGVTNHTPTSRQPHAARSIYPNEIDLRGLRVDEALEKVDGFLDSATLDRISTVRIIHGKGTGALRRAIREHLSDHPLVASAEPAEGPSGDGVTVVELA
jgi:DNA mismatch repair protein MutS2